MVSMLSVEPKASCANGRRRLRISSKELTCPYHLRSFFFFLVRNAFTPFWKRPANSASPVTQKQKSSLDEVTHVQTCMSKLKGFLSYRS